ncbi:hypothetical protein CERSUDRAFT_76915 [Gelatoporia subvermispora B]|uniref:Uncharacterized protein n=1 Tax=Ceriporiopsis subvermispora (strain B) TaxID=914234 RepID=M2R2W6_CERS8|nr:hypothetical protein CERSUDRAFT_76915 [Gelatoporia subvermispora B]
MVKDSEVATDILKDSITILEALKDGSDAICTVPCVGAVFAGGLGLLKTIETRGLQRMNASNGKCRQLTKRTTELIQYIDKQIAENIDDIDAGLTTNLEELSELLGAIQIDVVKQEERKVIVKFLRSSSIADKLSEHTEALDSAWRSFDASNALTSIACCLLSMTRKLRKQIELSEDQREFDDDLYQIFRPADLKPLEQRDDFLPCDGHPQGATLAEWRGRLVVKRVLRTNNTERWFTSPNVKPNVAVICKRYPRISHPHIAQVLGYSHPRQDETYYVIGTGGVPLELYLRNTTDAKAVLQIWLQTIARDSIAETAWKDKEVLFENHREFISFSTTCVDPSNRLIFGIDDLNQHYRDVINFWQFHYCDHFQFGDSRPGWVHNLSHLAPVQTSLSALQDNTYTTNFDHHHLRWYQSEMDLPHESSTSVRLGDYSYLSNDRQFIHFGNILDIISVLNGGPMDDSEIWEDTIFSSPRLPTQVSKDCASSLWYTSAIGSQWGHTDCFKWVRLSDRCLRLFWSYVVHVAVQKEIALTNIVIANDWSQRAEVKWYRRKCVGCRGRELRCRNCHGEETCATELSTSAFVDDTSLGGKFQYSVEDHIQDASVGSAPFSLNLYFHLTYTSSSKAEHGSLMSWGYWSLDPELCPGPWPDIVSDNFHVAQGHRSRVEWQFLPPLEAALFTYMNGYKLPPRLLFHTHKQFNPWLASSPYKLCHICDCTYEE